MIADAYIGQKGYKGSTKSVFFDNAAVFFDGKLAIAMDFPIEIADPKALLQKDSGGKIPSKAGFEGKHIGVVVPVMVIEAQVRP